MVLDASNSPDSPLLDPTGKPLTINTMANFFTKLPNGWSRPKKPDDEELKERNRETYGDSPGHSELFLNQTRGEFFASIDQVVRDVADFDEVTRLVELLRDNKHFGAILRGPLAPIMFNVYRKLTELGYSYDDLTI